MPSPSAFFGRIWVLLALGSVGCAGEESEGTSQLAGVGGDAGQGGTSGASPAGTSGSAGASGSGSSGAGGSSSTAGAGGLAGNAGAAGNAGSGGTGQAGSPNIPGFVFDPTKWNAVPVGDACGFSEANTTDDFPVRSWVDCGTGCTEAPARIVTNLDSTRNAVVGYNTTATYLGGDVYVKSSQGWPEPVGVIHTLSRLSDGRTLAAIRQDKNFASCGHVADASSGALTFAYSRSSPTQYLGAHYDLATTSLRWQQSWIADGLGSAPFQWDEGWGLSFFSGKIGVVRSLDATSFTALANEESGVFDTNGTGPWLVWGGAGAPDGSRIRAYHTVGGVQLIAAAGLDGNDSLENPVTDANRVVWLVRHRAQASGDYDTFDLAWTQLPSAGTGSSGPTQLVPLSTPGTNGLVYGTTLRLFGDYAVVLDCPIESVPSDVYCHARVRVVHLPTATTWAISHRQSKEFNFVLAVTAEEILIGERSQPAPIDEGDIETYLRFRLDSLDSLQQNL